MQQQDQQTLIHKIKFLEDENRQLLLVKVNLQETLGINKQLLNDVLGGFLNNEEDILGQLQEETDLYVGEIQRLQKERDELSSKVLLVEQINFDLTRKQIELSETFDKSQRTLSEQLNVMTYVADTREKFLTDALLTSNRVLAQLAKRDSKYARDFQKIAEIEKQRKQFTQNMVGKTELHMKSVLFERENLQMELEDAFDEIDTLK